MEKDFEEEYRAVFRALAGTGRALEVNTSSPLASVDQVRWFHEEGGEAVSFGSDAHRPQRSVSASTSPSTSSRRPVSGRAGTASTSGAAEGMRVRDATERDAEACAAIYAPYVTDTAITLRGRAAVDGGDGGRIAAAQLAHAWLVLEEDGRGGRLRLRRRRSRRAPRTAGRAR